MSRSRRQTGRERPGTTRKRPRSNGRFSSLLVVLGVLLLLVAGRLVQVQAIEGSSYAEKATAQRTKEITLSPVRGLILDRDGQVLAESVEARTIYAVPSSVTDKQAAAEAIAGVLGGSAEEYLPKLEKDTSFVYIKRKVDVEASEALEALELDGVGFIDDSKRVYPSGTLAAQLLGFVGVDDEGLSGLELYYDQVLGGQSGLLIAERDTRGRPILGGVTQEEPAVDGCDLCLTVDRDIQYQAELALTDAVDRYDAVSGTAIVMDPNDGSILAMATAPSFDPNGYSSFEQSHYRNRAVVDMYEPGSTVKSFTAAAVIESGLFGPDSTFTLAPTLKIGGYTIHESHERKTVDWSLTDIVTNSSNVGAATLGIALGNERLYESLTDFGFGTKTGVDYPGEAGGVLASPGQWSASSIATISFGQGIAVTPLQLARALAVVANGGTLVTPHLLAGVTGEASVTVDVPAEWPATRVLSAETAAVMREVLIDVVNEGTGAAAAVEGYEVAGKTGTAQKARTDGRSGYAPGKYIGSFSGFLPADDPQVLIVVVIDEPSGAYYGGTVAAPAFSRIASFCMEHLSIAPGETDAAPSGGAGQ